MADSWESLEKTIKHFSSLSRDLVNYTHPGSWSFPNPVNNNNNNMLMIKGNTLESYFDASVLNLIWENEYLCKYSYRPNIGCV